MDFLAQRHHEGYILGYRNHVMPVHYKVFFVIYPFYNDDARGETFFTLAQAQDALEIYTLKALDADADL